MGTKAVHMHGLNNETQTASIWPELLRVTGLVKIYCDPRFPERSMVSLPIDLLLYAVACCTISCRMCQVTCELLPEALLQHASTPNAGHARLGRSFRPD